MAGWKDILGTLQSTFKVTKLLAISSSGISAARTYTFPDASGQLVLKNPFGAATLTNNTVATTDTIVARWAIPANSLAANDNLELFLNGQVSSTATLIFRIRFGTAGNTTDALLATFTTSAAGAANAYHYLEGLVSFLTATTATATGESNLAGAGVGVVSAVFAATTVNLTVANFLSVSLVQNIAQTYTARAAKLSV